MKNNTFIMIIIFLVSIFLGSTYSRAQIEQPIDSYTITLTGTSLNTTNGLVITLSTSDGTLQLASGITLKANGATQLLTNVNSTTNVLSATWTGSIIDGKATISGKITKGSVTGKPVISVTKIQITGGKDVTSEVSALLTTSSSLPLPTPSPTPSPTPEKTCDVGEKPALTGCKCATGALVTSLDSCVCPTNQTYTIDGCIKTTPTISLQAPDIIDLTRSRKRKFLILVNGKNFKNVFTKCTATTSDRSILRVIPRKFLINSQDGSFESKLTGKVDSQFAIDLLNGDAVEETVEIFVKCKGQAEASKEILITAD